LKVEIGSFLTVGLREGLKGEGFLAKVALVASSPGSGELNEIVTLLDNLIRGTVWAIGHEKSQVQDQKSGAGQIRLPRYSLTSEVQMENPSHLTPSGTFKRASF
jgi:hypothetical protein